MACVSVLYFVGGYIKNTLQGWQVFCQHTNQCISLCDREDRIAKIPLRKMALYCLTWPTFDIIGRYAQYLALFMKVTWKTIPHESKIRIEDIKMNVLKENKKSIIFMALPFILMDVFTRFMGFKWDVLHYYVFVAALFTLLWTALIVGIVLSLRRRQRG